MKGRSILLRGRRLPIHWRTGPHAPRTMAEGRDRGHDKGGTGVEVPLFWARFARRAEPLKWGTVLTFGDFFGILEKNGLNNYLTPVPGPTPGTTTTGFGCFCRFRIAPASAPAHGSDKMPAEG